jgi:hypothetical protein
MFKNLFRRFSERRKEPRDGRHEKREAVQAKLHAAHRALWKLAQTERRYHSEPVEYERRHFA